MIYTVKFRVTSRLFFDRFSSVARREVFSDSDTIQQWLEVEAALAEARAELGIIPAWAAADIRTKADSALIPFHHQSNHGILTKYEDAEFDVFALPEPDGHPVPAP